MQGGALKGIRVIDVTTAILGPVATQILGDLGADVIKIESPEGDPMRNLGPAKHAGMASMFLSMNRNKRSVVLNLKNQSERKLLDSLVASADVFVHNMRPSAAKRLEIDYPHLLAHNARLIYASASGYGRESPHADKPAYDDIMQGSSGIAGLFQRSTDEARYAPFVIADKVVGYVLASAIMTALFARERTGEGQEVQVPMFETMVEFNILEHYWGRAFEPALSRPGYSRIFTRERRPFRTKDGLICVTATTDHQWARLFSAVGRQDLASDSRFSTMARRTFHFGEAYELLATEIAKETTENWNAAFKAADLPHGPVSSLDDLFDDEYLNAAHFFHRYDHPTEGRLVTTNPSVQYSKTPASFHRPPPRLGEHTKAVLQEFHVGLDGMAGSSAANADD